MEAWGLGYADLCQIKPDIILFSTSMLGRGGPYSQQPGFGPVLASLSGMTGLTGWPDRMPTNPYGAYTDFLVPRFAVPTILAALDYRQRTGRGQHLDMAQLEVSLQFMAPLLLDCTVNGREHERMGNRHAAAAPCGAYPCRGEDRWCTIACQTDAEWEALCQVMGQPAWTREHRFATLLGRKAHEDDLDALIGRWTREWEAYNLMRTLQQAGCSCRRGANEPGPVRGSTIAAPGPFCLLGTPRGGAPSRAALGVSAVACARRVSLPRPTAGAAYHTGL
jgi:benzylsuccinate CoA-transferase BbsF subunit